MDFKYDVYGNRIEKSYDADGAGGGGATVTRFAYDAWKNSNQHLVGNENWDVWADLNGSSSLTTRYIRGDVIDQIFARIDSGTNYWELTDRLGSVRDVINNSAVVKDTISYNGFGGITSETDSSFRGRYAWTGREIDTEINLQYNRARYFDANSGRWISEDPLGFDAGDANLYRYVSNTPPNRRDPSGLRECFCPQGCCNGLKSSTDLINDKVNGLIKIALAKGGNFEKVFWDATAKDVGPLGLDTAIEAWINEQQGYSIPSPNKPNFFARCIKISCAGKDFCIGVDKIGHFFQEGHLLYQFEKAITKRRPGMDVSDIVESFNYLTEGFPIDEPRMKDYLKGLGKIDFYLGKKNPLEFFQAFGGFVKFGVKAEKSLPDLAANSAGWQFWKDLLRAIRRDTRSTFVTTSRTAGRNLHDLPAKLGEHGMARVYFAFYVLVASVSYQEVALPGENYAAEAASDEARQPKETEVIKLIELINNTERLDDPAYKKAVAALKAIGREAVPPLVRLLTTSTDENMRLTVAAALGELGKNAEAAIPQLIQTVKDDKAPRRVRQYSWFALRMIGPDWSTQMPFLLWLLNKGETTEALSILEEMGPAAKPAIPALIELVKKDYSSRPMFLLGNLGPAAKDAVPVLINGLRSASYDHQRQAADEALGKIGPQTKEVVPALARALGDSHWWVREAAAQALGRIGPAANEAIPALAKALHDKQTEVRKAAATALEKVSREQK